MRVSWILTSGGFVSFFLGMAGVASAEGAFSLDLPPQGIYGGTDVGTCGWPTTVELEGACTGTLVHPQVVIYAQHCGTGYNNIFFGENINGGAGRTVKTEFCKTYPGGGPGTGMDFAFCKLAEPVTDVPIVPILMGCETSVLQPGQEVTIVGFGNADNGPYGVKREVTTTINSINNGEAFIGGNGKDSCQGDSGGPVFVKLSKSLSPQADDTWRVFGITSYGGACGTGGYYSMMHNGIAWFEQESGIDLTPCHEVDGTWKPTGACVGFQLDPGAGSGDWQSGCQPGPVAGASAICGPAVAPDDTPPTAIITAPMDGAEYTGEGGANVELDITVDAQDAEWGVKEVRLVINGKEQGGDSVPPYEWKAVSFPTGQWTIGAVVVDLADNMGVAEDVAIGVNMPAPEPEPETTGTSGGGTDGTDGTGGSGGGTGGTDGTGGSATAGSGGSATAGSGGSATATTGGEDEDEGCGCRQGGGGPAPALLLGFGALLLRRRRREQP